MAGLLARIERMRDRRSYERTRARCARLADMMRIAGAALFVSGLVIAACSSDPDADAFEVHRDGCSADACGARPEPGHGCVGGYAVTVCTKARGACGWQVDCAPEPPPGYDGNVGVGSCDGGGQDADACGPVPTYDEKDCVYGFIGEPSCESYDRAPCAWSRRCRAQPCEQLGTCNTLDRSKLGEPCGLEAPCPEGSTCASIRVNIGESVPPTCIMGDPCEALTCYGGRDCMMAESYPGQLGCSGR